MDDTALVLTLAAAVSAGTPLALAGIGELLTERSGVLNLGVEGMMILGAVTAFLVAHGSGSISLAFAGGALAAGVLGTVHAFVSITLRANQIVSGLSLVIFGTGLATYLGEPVEGIPLQVRMGRTSVPFLADAPIVGRILFQQDLVVYATLALAAVTALYLRHTQAGLALRAVGESPATADVAGVRVAAIRYAHTVAGGLLAGAGGAYIVLAHIPSWLQAATTNGVGWIAIALVVFAMWRPLRLLAGAFIFGAALRANFALQAAGFRAPAELLSTLPYLLTIATMLALSLRDRGRRSAMPSALGEPYAREERSA